MPKLNSEFPINLVCRASIPQRDYINEVAGLHGITPSEFLRGLVDAARVDHAIETIDGVLGPVQ